MSDIDNIFTKFQEIFKKAETLNDSASFSFIKANLPILRNSSNPQHRFVAMRLENKLKDNENFQTFSSAQVQVKKEETIKEERKEHYERYEMKSNQQAANNKVQEDKKKAAEAERVKNEDLAYYKRINDQVAYNARINQIFLELELEKQQEIIQVQEKFKPENQQAVRNFILDKTQTELEATQNLTSILNKEAPAFEHLKVSTKDGKTTVEVDPRTSVETLKDDSNKSNAVFKQALGVGNTEAAMASNHVATVVETTKATKEAKTSLEAAEKVLGKSVVDSENKDVQRAAIIKKQIDEAYPLLQDRINEIKQDTTYSDEEKDQMIKEAQEDFADSFAEQMKQRGYDMSNKETQDLVISELSSINFENNMNLEGEEQAQAETRLRDFSKTLQLDEKKIEQELEQSKKNAAQAIAEAESESTIKPVANQEDLEAKIISSKTEKINIDLNVKNDSNVSDTVKTDITSNNKQQENNKNTKATEVIFDKNKDITEVYSEMKEDKENKQKGEVIQEGISKNITEKAIENDGSIKESLKNSVDDSYAYQMAQEEAKRKDNNSSNELNKTAEEINKISNSNDGSNGPK